MSDMLTYLLPAASVLAAVITPWLAVSRARAHFEGVVDAKFLAIGERLANQDKATEKQFEGMQKGVKDALDRLYEHERELGGIAATINARGFSGR